MNVELGWEIPHGSLNPKVELRACDLYGCGIPFPADSQKTDAHGEASASFSI